MSLRRTKGLRELKLDCESIKLILNKFKHLNRYSYDRLISTSCVNNPEVSQYFEFDAYSTFLKAENKSQIIRRVNISLRIEKFQNKKIIFFFQLLIFSTHLTEEFDDEKVFERKFNRSALQALNFLELARDVDAHNNDDEKMYFFSKRLLKSLTECTQVSKEQTNKLWVNLKLEQFLNNFCALKIVKIFGC